MINGQVSQAEVQWGARVTCGLWKQVTWVVFFGLATGLQGLGIDQAIFSADITLEIAGAYVDDEELVIDDGSGIANIFLFGFPAESDADAYHEEGTGYFLFSFASPTTVDGTLAEAGDVISTDGATTTLALDASAIGLPDSVDVDAVGRMAGDLLVSFTTSLDLGGGVVGDDEDVLRVSGGSLSVALDSSAAGAPAALDLDALHWDEVSGIWYLSFDGPGEIGGLLFEGRDVLAHQPGVGWWIARRGSTASLPIAAGADLDALFVLPGLFADGFEVGDVSRWSAYSP